ncbi:MAG TPA: pilus assembly protein TadG-related protein [Gaiellaceae bacterium]|nr:pilus assembly protein TadG-related protein [Gaiellaceae bacterium]
MRRLADESGQSLVFFLLFLPSLVLLVGLVVNVGAWLQGQRHVQNVADAAALAAVQSLQSGNVQAVADSYANVNWAGSTVTLSGSSGSGTQSVSVHATHSVAGFIGVGGITVGANATARTQVADSVTNVSPFGVLAGSWQFGQQVTFRWSPPANAANSFAPIRFGGVNAGNFDTFAACDASAPAGDNCLSGTFSAPLGYRTLRVSTDALAAALQATENVTHLVGVYDSPVGGRNNSPVDVVGWAAFTIDDVREGVSPAVVVVTGHFDTFVGSPLPVGANPPTAADFGVRAVGLVK